MGDMLELAKKEILRKEILMLCRTASETGCSRQVVHSVAAKMGAGFREPDIDGELYYLQEKQLLRLEKTGNIRLGIQRDIYFITAAGIDYLDGTGPDIPGIGV
ncbi:MAG: hypothetical protein NC305_13380 [Lachnospiraceae bacterium]|nr:hypothetical protein [Butyrivibrio sp.]MCM1344010.1 hypothetical protein [Muribaculaceae bacterium]MCM1411523.1 hypothetical protein [Lachnospiraceae bacterium]